MTEKPFEDVPSEVVAWVDRLHEVADEVAQPIATAHAERLRCRAGCSDCCSDGLTVFTIEAALIAERHAALLAEGLPHAEGACAFLDDDGRCRIYAERPYVCRTQGLPLRWLDEEEHEGGTEIVESRDICPKNEQGGLPLEELPAEALFTLGPFEQRLAARQSSIDGGEGRRVALRSLFAKAPPRKHLPVL